MEFTDLDNPRIGNTGVQNTQEVLNTNYNKLFLEDYTVKGELKSLIDWCEFTIPLQVVVDKTGDTPKSVSNFEKVFEVLAIPRHGNFELDTSGKKLLGYSELYKNGQIKVLTNGTEVMGHHVIMSGRACREYEMHVGQRWKDLLRGVFENGGHFSRLDIAIDDFKGYFSVLDCYKKLVNGEVSSKFKFAKNIEKIRIADGYKNGQTIYYGSEKSELQIRMYEKNHEQECENEVDVWNRTELQLRDQRANNFALAFISDEQTVGQYASMVLKQYLTFKIRGNDSNKSRWKTAGWWDLFLGDVEGLQLTSKKPDRSIARMEAWLDKQLPRTMALMAIAKPDKYKELVLAGQDKLTDEDGMLILQYQAEQRNSKKALEAKKEIIKKDLLRARRLNQ